MVKLITERVIKKLNDYHPFPIPIGVSNRHVHLSQADLTMLFGEGYRLTPKIELKQPGQFACNETITIRGPKGEFERVRILGPVRAESQIEISITDSFRLGIHSPIRESGDLVGTPGLELIGPQGKVLLEYGAIVALRHIHMTLGQAAAMGLNDQELVEVETFGERRCILGDVLIRVSDQFSLEMHLDLDEANACALSNHDLVLIKRTS